MPCCCLLSYHICRRLYSQQNRRSNKPKLEHNPSSKFTNGTRMQRWKTGKSWKILTKGHAKLKNLQLCTATLRFIQLTIQNKKPSHSLAKTHKNFILAWLIIRKCNYLFPTDLIEQLDMNNTAKMQRKKLAVNSCMVQQPNDKQTQISYRLRASTTQQEE